MPLTPGTHLGPYEILAPLGAGGMGEVYKGRDTRLDRTVAIKILSPDVSSHSDFRERFEREAKAISSLNHPHICTLHDIGHQDGIDYLVMEYIEGETLAQRLTKGALPVDQVLRYAIEIADALEKAHRHGVIHRDLKPGNIMLTESGAKLLDFGLAKLRQAEAPAVGPTAIPTQSPLTAAGTILGTFQYMAPEQLEGKEADARTDIFSFGAVLYEMATGRKAFEGKSQASLIGAILYTDPPAMSVLQPLAPPALDRFVSICLAKDPADRWQTMHDLKLQLKWIAEGGSQAGIPAPVGARRKQRERLAWGIAMLAVLLSVTLAIGYFYYASPEVKTLRFQITVPEKATFSFFGIWGAPPIISPDGKRIAFVAAFQGKQRLWVRPLSSLTAQMLPGTEGAYFPFWSPDSRFIGFFSEDGKLKKVEAAGGPAQTLCTVTTAAKGGTWGRDGVILFAPASNTPIHTVTEAGGKSVPVTSLDSAKGQTSHRWPHFLPDGRHFLFLSWSAKEESKGIYLGSLDSKENKRLLADQSNVVFAPPGYLLFVRERALMAQRFDPGDLELKDQAFPLIDQVGFDDPSTYGLFSSSDDGVLAYGHGTRSDTNSQLVWFDRQGKQLGTLGPPGSMQPALSPDEKKVAVSRAQSGNQDIWLIDVARGVSSRFTFDGAAEAQPVWSPDGSQILFYSGRSGQPDLYYKISSGAGKDELLLGSKAPEIPMDWSDDGRFVLYLAFDEKTRMDLWVLPTTGERKPVSFLNTDFDEVQAQFSPDVRWIAYSSNESGRHEVYVQPFPATGAKWQISTDGGLQPQWRRDGEELFYLTEDQKLMAVELQSVSTFEYGIPTPLFQIRTGPLVGGRNNYLVSGDGKRFLVHTITGEAASLPITVVVNWTAGLAK